MGGNAGGIGAFAGGFAKSFAASREQRRLRDLDLMREQQKAAHEKRMEEQFREQQDFRVKQQQAVETYRAGQMQLQEKQAAIQKKKLDLDIMGGMEKAFDPKVPKAQRQFILKQTFKTMEIDPKSAEAQDFMKMATGLDDEQLKETRNSLLTMLPEASPGEVTAFAKAIVSGQLQMKDALATFHEARRAKKLEEINRGTGGGGSPTRQVPTSRITNPQPMSQQQPGGDMPIPGMEQPAGAGQEPTAGGATAQQLRDRASELFAAGFTTEGSAQAQLARDLDNQKDLELKEVVGPDKKHIWVREDQAEGMEAPSARPVRTAEEERVASAGKASVEADYARVKPWLEDATRAKDTGPVIEALKIANKSGKFTTGAFSNVRENATKWAELLGATDLVEGLTGLELGNPAVAETIKSGSAQLGTLLADKLGRATNMQVGYIQEALPGLMKTQRGNEIAIDLLERANERSLKLERLYDKYQDDYGGDLRPPGKPSFFAEADRLRRQPLVENETELEKEIKAEAKKGNAIDVEKLWEKAKAEAKVLIGGDEYEKVGETEKGLPIIKYGESQFPYVATDKDKSKVEEGMYFLWNDPVEGPTMTRRKKKKAK